MFNSLPPSYLSHLSKLTLLAACLSFQAASASDTVPAPPTGSPAAPPSSQLSTTSNQPRIQEFVMTSRDGQDYQISVSAPAGEPPPLGYGVMVLLDANAYFGTAANAMELIRQFPLVPEGGKLVETAATLVVGVGYPKGQVINGVRRTRDFLQPARNPASLERLRGPQPGGAAAFTTFLTEDLRAAIGARYPVDARRQTLAGHSLGASYVLHVLTDKPDAFQRYVAISPAVWWDDSRILTDLAAARFGNAKLMLVMAQDEWPGWPVGSTEMLDGARAVRNVVLKAGLPADALRYVEIRDQDHMTTPFAVMPMATRFAALP
ncbi:alpha/beta hydrolase [Pigmentiphaga litoralis]|uniref:alpha/beta hydrolase n=1 Tax=Pigmentiphaga litoralis TaxID=516702 RepID=UPI003B4387BB